jgi:NADPH2:quinone reductase
MRAVVLTEPGSVENLQIREIPKPLPQPGWVRIKVMAFGLNRSELHIRLGWAEGVTFPRVLGVVDAAPDGDLIPGQQVATLMGGMGRTFDGGYAQYTVVPRRQVIPFTSDLPWHVIGAVPETLQTAYGALTIGLDLTADQTLLVRGGTRRSAWPRRPSPRTWARRSSPRPDGRSARALLDHGVDHVVIDDGAVTGKVRTLVPEGVTAALEPVGTPTLPDTLRATRVHGTVCFAGMLSNVWTVQDSSPVEFIPRGVRLTAYSGGSDDLPPQVLQTYLDRLAAGSSLGPISVHTLDEVREAHLDLEHSRTVGKHVVLPHPLNTSGGR